MEIILKKDWDVPVTPPHETNKEDKGFFIGREKELQLLEKELFYKDHGSILISGHRGAGKTSLVYKALHSFDQRPDTNLLLVLINAGQFNVQSGEKDISILPENILKTIIRRLYAVGVSQNSKRVKDSKAKVINDFTALEKLYKKAVAKEYKSQENYKDAFNRTSTNEIKKETTFSIKDFGFKEIAKVIGFIVAIWFVFYSPSKNPIYDAIMALLVASPIPGLISYTWSRVNNNKLTEEQNRNTELLYQMDNNISNLEYDLEELHKKLNADGWNVIYVVDELDKLGETKNVSKVIKYFKNLFTLSKAIFLFIGNEDIYKTACLEEAIKEETKVEGNVKTAVIYRPEEYTYFSSKYFIARPTWDEILEYLDKCMVPQEGISKRDRQMAMHYLAMEAKNDFFDLVNIIKDKIVRYDEEGHPVIAVQINKPDNIKKARFHKAMVNLFYKRYYLPNLSMRYENEQSVRLLMKHSCLLISAQAGTVINDPEEDNTSSAAIRDLNSYLCKLKVFDAMGFKDTERSYKIRQFVYHGYFNEDPPDRLNILSEFEKGLLKQSENYLLVVLPLINFFRKKSGGIKNDLNLQDLIFSLERIEIDSLLALPAFLPPSEWQSIFLKLYKDETIDENIREQVQMIEAQIQEVSLKVNNCLSTIYFDELADSLFFKELTEEDAIRSIFEGAHTSWLVKRILSSIRSKDVKIIVSGIEPYKKYNYSLIVKATNVDFILYMEENTQPASLPLAVKIIAQTKEEYDVPSKFEKILINNTSLLVTELDSKKLLDRYPMPDVSFVEKMDSYTDEFNKIRRDANSFLRSTKV